MKLKIIFWILLVFVFGSLSALGFYLFSVNFKLFVCVEVITVLAVILFVVFYLMLLKPYQTISSGMDLLKQQDFSSRLRPVGHDVTDRLIEMFNKMLGQLKEERLRVREQNHFLDLLVNASPQGVIILDFDEKITQINPSGLRLLGLNTIDDAFGKRLDETGVELARQLSGLREEEDIVLRISGLRLYRCSRSSFLDRGFSHPFILIEELTHEIMKIEKKSYENIIRMMAHEVNNSVASVSATLNIISDSLQDDPDNTLADVLPAVEASFERCNHLSRFITNLADVVKIPPPVLLPVDLNELLRSVRAFIQYECDKRNIRLSLFLSEDPCIVQADSIQLEQVLVNLIKNAYESIQSDGEICVSTQTSPLSLTIEDNGPGISPEIREKLFTPFFTTKPSGQGIGLLFVREVLLNHACRFAFATEEDGKTRFRIGF